MPKRSVADPEEAYDLSDEELQQVYTWVDSLTLSRPKRNIHRDFSDGVLLAGESTGRMGKGAGSGGGSDVRVLSWQRCGGYERARERERERAREERALCQQTAHEAGGWMGGWTGEQGREVQQQPDSINPSRRA